MDFNKIIGGMFILIGLYLFARFSSQFDLLFGTGSAFVQHQTAILQGNYPFGVQTPSVAPGAVSPSGYSTAGGGLFTALAGQFGTQNQLV